MRVWFWRWSATSLPLFLALCVSLGSAWAEEAETGPPDIARILQRGSLVVAMYHRDVPPFFFVDGKGEMDGFDVRLIKDFAARMGVEVSFLRTAETFDEVADQVARGEADLAVSKLSRTFKRTMRVRYTRPYVILRQGLLVNRLLLARQAEGRTEEETIRTLSGRIGVLGNSSYEVFAKQRFPEAQVVGFETWEEVVAAAAAGKLTAAYRDELEIKKIIRAKGDNLLNFQTVILSDTRDPIAIAVNWRAPALLDLLDTYLEDQEISVTADEILDQFSDRGKASP